MCAARALPVLTTQLLTTSLAGAQPFWNLRPYFSEGTFRGYLHTCPPSSQLRDSVPTPSRHASHALFSQLLRANGIILCSKRHHSAGWGHGGGDPGPEIWKSSRVRAEGGGENTLAHIRGQIDVSALIVPGKSLHLHWWCFHPYLVCVSPASSPTRSFKTDIWILPEMCPPRLPKGVWDDSPGLEDTSVRTACLSVAQGSSQLPSLPSSSPTSSPWIPLLSHKISKCSHPFRLSRLRLVHASVLSLSGSSVLSTYSYLSQFPHCHMLLSLWYLFSSILFLDSPLVSGCLYFIYLLIKGFMD